MVARVAGRFNWGIRARLPGRLENRYNLRVVDCGAMAEDLLGVVSVVTSTITFAPGS